MASSRCILFVLLLSTLTAGSFAAFAMGPPREENPQEADQEEREAAKPRFVALPFIYYTPETSIAAGAGGVLRFRAGSRKEQTRNSTVWVLGTYSLARQFQISVNPAIYFERNRVFLGGMVRYERTPQRFYGVGNDTVSAQMESYTPRIALIQLAFRKALLGGLYAGVHYEFEKTTIERTEPGGVLDAAALPGSRGGLVSGIGLSLDWDTRDSVLFPRKGSFHQLAANIYRPFTGSDFSYNSLKMDLRRYFSPVKGQVLAVQVHLRFTSGETPFYRLSLLGGDSLMRGYYKGRFRDQKMIVVQAEHRVALGGRFGLAGFAGIGRVFPRFADFDLKGLKYSLGTGLRYSLDARENTNVRMDLAWGVRSFGLYFTAQESF